MKTIHKRRINQVFGPPTYIFWFYDGVLSPAFQVLQCASMNYMHHFLLQQFLFCKYHLHHVYRVIKVVVPLEVAYYTIRKCSVDNVAIKPSEYASF